MSRRFHGALVGLSIALGGMQSAEAGPYADDMAKCLIEATTTDEKGMLVKWIFGIASLHPQLKSVSSITPSQRTDLNKGVAALLESLVTDTCKVQTLQALRYEGQKTMQSSFSVLGEAAMMELFSDEAVAKGLHEYIQYLDKEKFEAAFSARKPEQEEVP